MEWDYSGRKERDGQKKKIGKAKERKKNVKREKGSKWTRGEEGCPGPTWGTETNVLCAFMSVSTTNRCIYAISAV